MDYEKILVTGAAGFIGYHLIKRLLDQGKEVVGIDNLSNGREENILDIEDEDYKFLRRDVRKRLDIREAIQGCDAVFHLAAQSSVPNSTQDLETDLEINLDGTLNVLREARQQGAKVVFASTSTVYGTPSKLPTPESSAQEPISFYGASKTSAEAYCFAMNGTHNLPVVSLRLYNVYGPRNHKGVMYDFFQKLNKNPSSLEILGTGEQTKDYVYITDTIDAFMLALKKAEGGKAYNIGSGEAYSVNEIAEITFDLMDIEPEVNYTGGKGWKGDVEKTKADISKAKRELGWDPKIELKEGMSKFYNWYKENYD